MVRYVFMLLLVLLLAAGGPVEADARENRLTVLYMERPPYYATHDGKPAGFLLEQALAAFHEAGLEVTTKVLPVKRILQIVRDGQEQVATVGWFKNAERTQWARFSTVLYRDQPLLALHKADAGQGLGDEAALRSLLQDKELVLGVLDGFSYGERVDAMIAEHAVNRFVLSGDQVQLIRMLGAGRIDYILVAPEEVSYLLGQARYREVEFGFTLLNDVPEGNRRYIMYSRAVPSSVIRRVDEAIDRRGQTVEWAETPSPKAE